MGEVNGLPSTMGKAVIVTGGLSGIGLAIVQHFASPSSSSPNPSSKSTQTAIAIAILDISSSSSPSTIKTLASLRETYPKTNFTFKQCDISSWENQRECFEEVYREFGGIGVVCANAGVTEIGKVLGDEFEEGEGEKLRKPNLKTLDVDLVGTIYSIKLATHYMSKNPSPAKKGVIICTASNAGLYPFPIAPLYAISKHAVVGAVRSFAMPLEGMGIRINGICPNCIETGLADDNLFAHMTVTPMSTLVNAVEELTRNDSHNGVIAEISGDKYTFRGPPEYVDDISRKNIEAFWTLGYA